eukprot:TRINITY_DN32273_c0_g1_i1.p1 TRINITY_DN32273_c0_g1~~TRINITY_DN32273_c0_g1_i1.p1  ORF type:complete len:1514 (+),score=356.94 TRINITY_DN32273_c0_g1_i1:36-4577(+)
MYKRLKLEDGKQRSKGAKGGGLFDDDALAGMAAMLHGADGGEEEEEEEELVAPALPKASLESPAPFRPKAWPPSSQIAPNRPKMSPAARSLGSITPAQTPPARPKISPALNQPKSPPIDFLAAARPKGLPASRPEAEVAKPAPPAAPPPNHLVKRQRPEDATTRSACSSGSIGGEGRPKAPGAPPPAHLVKKPRLESPPGVPSAKVRPALRPALRPAIKVAIQVATPKQPQQPQQSPPGASGQVDSLKGVLTGTISKKGDKFGSISSAQVRARYGCDIVVPALTLLNFQDGEQVEFRLALNHLGKPQACNVKPLGEGDQGVTQDSDDMDGQDWRSSEDFAGEQANDEGDAAYDNSADDQTWAQVDDQWEDGAGHTENLHDEEDATPNGNMGSKAELVEQVKALQRSDPGAKEAWWNYCDMYLQGVKDPNRHDEATLQEFLSSYESGGHTKNSHSGEGGVPMGSKTELVDRVRQLQRADPGARQAWSEHCETQKGIKDPNRHDAASLHQFLSNYESGVGQAAMDWEATAEDAGEQSENAEAASGKALAGDAKSAARDAAGAVDIPAWTGGEDSSENDQGWTEGESQWKGDDDGWAEADSTSNKHDEGSDAWRQSGKSWKAAEGTQEWTQDDATGKDAEETQEWTKQDWRSSKWDNSKSRQSTWEDGADKHGWDSSDAKWQDAAGDGGDQGWSTDDKKWSKDTQWTSKDAPSEGLMVGTVKMKGDKYGFIKSPEVHAQYGCDVYVPAAILADLQQGDQVEFTIKLNYQGKPQAYNVKAASSGSASADGEWSQRQNAASDEGWTHHDSSGAQEWNNWKTSAGDQGTKKWDAGSSNGQDASANDTMTGTVKKKGDKYGFIKSPEAQAQYGGDVFAIASELANVEEGDQVEFSVVLNRQGKPQAQNVRAQGSGDQEWSQRKNAAGDEGWKKEWKTWGDAADDQGSEEEQDSTSSWAASSVQHRQKWQKGQKGQKKADSSSPFDLASMAAMLQGPGGGLQELAPTAPTGTSDWDATASTGTSDSWSARPAEPAGAPGSRSRPNSIHEFAAFVVEQINLHASPSDGILEAQSFKDLYQKQLGVELNAEEWNRFGKSFANFGQVMLAAGGHSGAFTVVTKPHLAFKRKAGAENAAQAPAKAPSNLEELSSFVLEKIDQQPDGLLMADFYKLYNAEFGVELRGEECHRFGADLRHIAHVLEAAAAHSGQIDIIQPSYLLKRRVAGKSASADGSWAEEQLTQGNSKSIEGNWAEEQWTQGQASESGNWTRSTPTPGWQPAHENWNSGAPATTQLASNNGNWLGNASAPSWQPMQNDWTGNAQATNQQPVQNENWASITPATGQQVSQSATSIGQTPSLETLWTSSTQETARQPMQSDNPADVTSAAIPQVMQNGNWISPQPMQSDSWTGSPQAAAWQPNQQAATLQPDQSNNWTGGMQAPSLQPMQNASLTSSLSSGISEWDLGHVQYLQGEEEGLSKAFAALAACSENQTESMRKDVFVCTAMLRGVTKERAEEIFLRHCQA